MNNPIFTTKKSVFLTAVATVCFFILAAGVDAVAQYKGAPVQKERLVRVLRSRQLQTRDIVSIINSNGVDFRMTAEIRKSLVAAGARPEVIEAVTNNPRLPPKIQGTTAQARPRAGRIRRTRPAPPDYDDLLNRAMYFYKEQRNPNGAVRILQSAAKVKPENPAAYQMLGFVYLYGLNNFVQAEKSMRDSLANGGSAVFRVFHDDNGKFSERCTGSLYISRDSFRFESDDNVHTFETSAANIDKIKLDTESTGTWKKHSIFKIFLKIGKDKANFRFAPLTGEKEESRMVERFIAASNSKIYPSASAMMLAR